MQDLLNGAPYEGELPRIDMPLGTPESLSGNRLQEADGSLIFVKSLQTV